MKTANTIETLNAAVVELKSSLITEQQNLIDAEHDFNEAVACEAADDELSDCQSYIEQRGFAVKRAEARLKAAEGEVQAFLAKSKAEAANLHHEAGNAGLARVMEKQRDAVALAGQMVKLSAEINGMLSNANEHRREAKALGIPAVSPGFPPVDLADAIAAMKLISGASSRVWFGLY